MKKDIWKEYCENTKHHPPRPLLTKALSYVDHRDVAIDLGSGALVDSKYLLDEGFTKVIAVDKKPVALEIAKTFPADRFEYVISTFESFDFPSGVFDLVNAQYSLPFTSPDHFKAVFQRIAASLREGGIFTGQLFGDKDAWSSDPDKIFHTKAEAEKLLSEFEVILFEEKEEDNRTAAGQMKHWHIFDFIVKK